MNQDLTKWYEDARFGLFIHWGLYSIPAGVWNGERMGRNWYAEWMQAQGNWPHGVPAEEYRALASQLDGSRFDADEWISLAKQAGMKYFLFTAKHHDGFAFWPTEVSSFNVVEASPLGRDVCGELAEACRRHGIVLGFYYSQWQDWEHPGGANPPWPEIDIDPEMPQPTQDEFEAYWNERCLVQVGELIDAYDPGLFWFDNWCKSEFLTPERLDSLIALVHGKKPGCLVNSRIGTTWNHPEGDDIVDYRSMHDNEFPEEAMDCVWETSGTMNRSWGYHQLDFQWKTSGHLLRRLVDNASRGGNFQLNVGPKASGEIPAPSVRRLREMGAWLEVNGEALYGTRRCLLPEPAWGRLMARNTDGATRIYCHVYDWKPGARLEIAGLAATPTDMRVLETGQPVEVEPSQDGIAFVLPEDCPDQRIAVLALDIDGDL